MIQMILTVCAIATAQCKEVDLRFFEQGVSMFACMRYGQVEVEKWTKSHPGWNVKRWKCTARPEDKA